MAKNTTTDTPNESNKGLKEAQEWVERFKEAVEQRFDEKYGHLNLDKLDFMIKKEDYEIHETTRMFQVMIEATPTSMLMLKNLERVDPELHVEAFLERRLAAVSFKDMKRDIDSVRNSLTDISSDSEIRGKVGKEIAVMENRLEKVENTLESLESRYELTHKAADRVLTLPADEVKTLTTFNILNQRIDDTLRMIKLIVLILGTAIFLATLLDKIWTVVFGV